MPAAPLAGRPPFATDEPDSTFDESPSPTKRRAPPPKPDNPNQRSSAYDVYENYLSPSDAARNPNGGSSSTHLRNASSTTDVSRNSGIGALGMGLLAMDSDDDDDSDDEDAYERRRRAEREKASAAGANNPDNSPSTAATSKNAALAAAVSGANKTSSPTVVARAPSRSPSPTLEPPSPPPIAAPRPGYAGPTIATLGVKTPSPMQGGQQQLQNPFANPPGLGRAPSHNAPGGFPQHHNPPGAPPGLNINMSLMNQNTPSPAQHHSNSSSPIAPPPAAMMRGMTMTPAPLAPPMTPIKPVFAVPKGNFNNASTSELGHDEKGSGGGGGGLRWDDLPAPTPRKPIMRSGTEDALLPARGEKGDDFWRRFSMIAKSDEQKKESPWLKKTVGGTNRLRWWVWLVGLLILGVIGAAVGLGLYFTKDDPDHQKPEVLAGAEGSQKGDPNSAKETGSISGKESKTVLHVTPDFTLDERALFTEVAPVGGRAEATPCLTAQRQEPTAVLRRHVSAAKKRRF